MGSSFKLWSRRLEGTTLTRGQILQFCNAIAAGAYGFTIGGHTTNLTPHECALLMEQFGARVEGYELTAEHERFGLAWLKANTRRAESLGISQDLLREFKAFRFVDTKIASISDWGPRAHIVPVYRVLTHTGVSVDYSWSPWQRTAYA